MVAEHLRPEPGQRDLSDGGRRLALLELQAAAGQAEHGGVPSAMAPEETTRTSTPSSFRSAISSASEASHAAFQAPALPVDEQGRADLDHHAAKLVERGWTGPVGHAAWSGRAGDIVELCHHSAPACKRMMGPDLSPYSRWCAIMSHKRAGQGCRNHKFAVFRTKTGPEDGRSTIISMVSDRSSRSSQPPSPPGIPARSRQNRGVGPSLVDGPSFWLNSSTGRGLHIRP